VKKVETSLVLNKKIYIHPAPYYRKKPHKLLQPCSVANTDSHCIRIYMALRVRIRDPYPNKPKQGPPKRNKNNSILKSCLKG
jgi:hypothetical protein